MGEGKKGEPIEPNVVHSSSCEKKQNNTSLLQPNSILLNSMNEKVLFINIEHLQCT